MYLNIYEISFSKTEVPDIWISKLLVLFSLRSFCCLKVRKSKRALCWTVRSQPKFVLIRPFLTLLVTWTSSIFDIDQNNQCWMKLWHRVWHFNAIVLWPLYKWKNASYSLYMTPSDGFWDLVSCVPKKDTQTLQKVLNWNLLAASSRVLALAEWMTSEPV